MPSSQVVQIMRQAVAHHQAGRLQQAETLYRQALQLNPSDPDALQLLGLLAHQSGRHADAADLILQAIAVRPRPEFYVNLSQAYRGMGMLRDSADACRRAIDLAPQLPEAHNNLGTALKDLGRHADAVQSFLHAIALRPNYLNAHTNLGNALMAMGKFTEAEAALRKALSIDANFPEALSNLGHLLNCRNRFDDAIEACQKAIAVKPDLAAAYVNLGTALHQQGRFDEGNAAYERGLALEPNNPRLGMNLLAGMSYSTRHSPREILEAHARWGQRIQSAMLPPPAHSNDCSPDRRLRIGFVSADFRAHSVAYFIEAIFASHDRGKLEITAYADVSAPDATTQRLRSMCEQWREIVGVPDSEVAQGVRDDKIDILIDLAGHTAGNRLPVFARKPAPIQITYLGYPSTTGLTTMDYRLTDEIADPPGETDRFHTERLVRLPPPFLCYAPPPGTPSVAQLPAARNGYVTFGSFNKAAKIGPETIVLWANVLRAVPGSKLVMKAWGLGGGGSRRRLIDAFAAEGFGMERIEIIEATPSQIDHLNHYGAIDVALDTFPYHGTTTTCEALWMGVPVISLLGKTHVSRVGATLLSAIGLSELAVEGESAFVNAAQRLATDLTGLTELRRTLRDRMQRSLLTDAASFSTKFEAALRRLWLEFTISH